MSSPIAATHQLCHGALTTASRPASRRLAESRSRRAARPRVDRDLLISHPKIGIIGGRALEHREGDRAQLVVLHRGAQEADRAAEVLDWGSGRRKLVVR